MTSPCWMLLLLFCLCCHHEIRRAACKPLWMRPQFPCYVTASNTSSEVRFDCKGRRLESVPRGITYNATEIDLSENNIKNISVSSFSKLSNLTRLDLSWANRQRKLIIDPNAFRNLTKLRELRLAGNGLVKIPGDLPRSLRKLGLHMSRIQLDDMNFTGLTNLTHLWLSKNCHTSHPCGRLYTIEDGIFDLMTKLYFLELSFNNLTQIPKILLKSLRILKLASNRIQNIYEDDFQGLENLKVLYIQGNCPRCQNAPFPCVPCQNGSLGIHPNAFNSLTHLEQLNMGGNSLTHLNESWFKNLGKLKQLALTFNFLLKVITEDATFLSYLPRLEKMDLSFNFGLQVYPKTLNLSSEFSKLVSLRIFHLEGLVFQNLGLATLSPLYELKNLSALNLGTNFLIYSDSHIFNKFSNLKMIYLAENRLHPVPVHNPPSPSEGYSQRSHLSISPLTTPYKFDFSYELTHTLIKQECYDSGRVLILSSNNLFFISPEQFQGYGNIACLNLSNNGFSAALNGTEFSLLPNLTYLDLSFNKIDLAFDNAFKELKKLQVLDLSYNNHYFSAFGVTHNLNFTQNLPVLRVLNMSHNSITTLTTKRMYSKSLAELQFTHNVLGKLWGETDGSYERLFANLINLTILDISYNYIKKIPKNVYKYLPRNLTMLRVSHNKLTDFEWHKLKCLDHLLSLDLSYNALSNVMGMDSNVSHTLISLDLSHNYISQLGDGFLKGVKSLKILSLSFNRLTVINQSSFQPRPKNQIQTLFLERNPFECTCHMLDFILWIEDSGVKIPRLTADVNCSTPENQEGNALIEFDIRSCVDDSQAFLIYVLTNSSIVFFMLAATAAHLFYWDASYFLHYLRAKLEGYVSLDSQGSCYDVFVTYDTGDPHVSEWVMRDLRVKLEEEGDKRLPLCLEERDWPLGVPLVENLTQSIRHSRKTLFVLTKGYVRTGVFRLAMYLAHQRLLDENTDVIVLLMLEPVLRDSHFLHLRRRLCERSIVEWPRTAAAEPWFWQNLRNVVRVDNQAMYNKTYSQYFASH